MFKKTFKPLIVMAALGVAGPSIANDVAVPFDVHKSQNVHVKAGPIIGVNQNGNGPTVKGGTASVSAPAGSVGVTIHDTNRYKSVSGSLNVGGGASINGSADNQGNSSIGASKTWNW